MCYEINCILSKYGYFLRIFELKKKYRSLAVKDKSEQKIVRQLSSCLIEKFTQRFYIVILHRFQSNMKKAKNAF